MEFSHKESKAVPALAIEALAGELTPYLTHLRRVAEAGDYAQLESSINVPGDEYMLDTVEAIIDRVYTRQLRYVVVIGIGGSNLGTKALYDMVAQARDTVLGETPRLIFLETTDPALLYATKQLIQKAGSHEELLFVVISKSGTTTETIVNAEVVLEAFADRFGRRAGRVVVVSEDGSPLLRAAKEQQMLTVALPKVVGGRYSVFTPVGLLPLGLLGLPVRELRTSAEAMLQRSLHPDIALNPAGLSALTQFYFYKQGIRQHDTFVFSPGLESLGRWYRQLLAESLGKSAVDGTARIGITPTVSVGSTDLHSVGQLYLGGPKDRLTTFVAVGQSKRMVAVPGAEARVWPTIVPALAGKSANAVQAAILAGTKAAYDQNDLPYLSVTLAEQSVAEGAAFMQMKMCEVMMLGHLFRVNPFDQPHVEQYKTVTKHILER